MKRRFAVPIQFTNLEAKVLYDAMCSRLQVYYGTELKAARRAHEKLRQALVIGAMASDFSDPKSVS